MRIFIVILLCVSVLMLLKTEPTTRNLVWFEAKGEIENYRSSDGSKVRPKLVLFSHDWDLISRMLKIEIVELLKSQPNNNPILLDADCTDYLNGSGYVKILKAHNLGRSLPVMGIHDDKGWQFIDCNAELSSDRNEPTQEGVKRLVEIVTSELAQRGR